MGQFVAGLAQGLGQGIVEGQKRKDTKEYQQALIDQAKAHGKLYEAQMILADKKAKQEEQFQAMLANIFQSGVLGPEGGPVPAGGPQAPAPMPSQPGIFEGASPMPIPGMPGGPLSSAPLSERNFNPGNLRFVGQPGATQGQGGFAAFPTMEAGWQGLRRQIEIDKARNLTLSQFIAKYAPPSENDTQAYINFFVQKTGAKPDTPLSQIPTDVAAQAIATYETGKPMTPPGGGLGSPRQAIPSGPLTGMTVPQGLALDIMMKRGADLNTPFLKNALERGDVSKTVDTGTMTLLLDRTGRVIGGIPKDIETQLVEREKPTGEKEKVAVPKYLTPGAAMQTAEPGTGMAMDKVGKLNLVGNAMQRNAEVNSMVFAGGDINKGSINRTLLFKAATPMGGIGEGSILHSKMWQAVDAALRLETGAQATPGEIEVKMKEFWPSVKDTDAAIRSKLGDFNQYIVGVGKLADPTGVFMKTRQPGQAPSGPSGKADYRFNPKTGKLEAVQ